MPKMTEEPAEGSDEAMVEDEVTEEAAEGSDEAMVEETPATKPWSKRPSG